MLELWFTVSGAAKRPRDPAWLVDEPATTLHPLYAWNRTDRLLHDALHEDLFEPDGDGLRSDVVSAWSVADGVLSLTLAAREWSDGRPLVNADVCATLERLEDDAHPTAFTGLVRAVAGECTADPLTPTQVALTLRRPMADPREWLAVPLLPAHRPDWSAWVPGSGAEPPFVGLGRLEPKADGADWVLSGPDGFRVRQVDDPLAAFQAGEGTRIWADPADLGALRGLPGVEVRKAGEPVVYALFLDTTRPPFDDVAARHVLDAGLDRVALASALFGRDETLPRQPWAPVSGPWPTSSARASKGVPVPSPTPEAIAATKAFTGALALPGPIGAGWAEALPGLTPKAVTPTEYWLSVLGGGHATASTAAFVRLDGPVCAWFESRGDVTGPRNVFGFSDPEIDRLCGALDRGDPEVAWSLHGWLADQLPAIFLFSHQDRVAVRVP